MSDYDALFAKAAADNGIPVDLLKSVAQAESTMDPKATSKDANGNIIARGIMQLVPTTAKALGVTDPFDPAQAIPAGAKLLKANLDASGGDEKQALMMYHGGPDTANWGPKTAAYPGRVADAGASLAKASLNSDPMAAYFNSGGKTLPGTGATAPSAPSAPAADPMADYFASGGKNIPGAVPAPKAPTTADSAGVAQGKRIAALYKQVGSEASTAGVYPTLVGGALEGGVNIASNYLSSVIGGIAGAGHGLASLVQGKGVDQSIQDASNTINKIQQAATYQPRSAAGKMVGEIGSVPINIAGEALGSTAGDVGQYLNGDKGRLAGEALGHFAPAAAAAVLGRKPMVAAANNALEAALSASKKLQENAGLKGPVPTTQTPPPGSSPMPNRLAPLVKVDADGTVTRLDGQGSPTPSVATPPPVAAANPLVAALGGAKPRLKLNADGSTTPIAMDEAPIEFNSKPVPPTVPAPPPEVAPPAMNEPPIVPPQLKPGAPAPDELPPPISEPPIKFEDASPELKAHVADLEKSGKPVNQEALNRHLEAESLPVPMRLSKGEATQDPTAISMEQNSRGTDKGMSDFFQQHNKDLVANTNAIKQAAAPDVHVPTQAAAGEALIKSGSDALAADHANIKALYKKMEDANGGEFPVDGPSIVKAAEASKNWKLKGRFLPAEIKSLLADMKSSKTPMTFDDFEALRTTLAEESRKAARNGDGNAKYALGLVRNAAESIPMEGATASVKALADAARSANAKFHAKLEADPALSAIEDDTARPDNFVQKYVISAKRREAAALRDNLAGDPEAKQVLSAAIINHLKEAAGLKGDLDNFSQSGYRTALKKLNESGKLDDLLPGQQAQQVKTLGNVAFYTQHQPRGAFVANSNTPIAQAAMEAAKTGVEGSLNYLTHGVPVASYLRRQWEARSAKNKLMESIQPGAGI